MNWQIVVRFGRDDRFTPDVPAGVPVLVLTVDGDDEGQQVRTNCFDTMEDQFGRRPEGVSLELLLAAVGVYCADMAVSRERTTVDRWTRSFTLHMPVADVAAWEGVSTDFVRMLRFLTGDEWSMSFRASEPREQQQNVATSTGEVQDICLFSGGLDSTTGAIDLLAANRQVVLVGHYGAGMTHSFQDAVLTGLQAEYGDAAQALLVHLQPPQLPEEVEHENTARSRSLLFIAFGVAAAALVGEGTTLYIPENGLISLNVPMTATRSGSLSTRTTHPHFIGLLRGVLNGLRLEHPLRLPYCFQTKGEMLRECGNADLIRKLTPLTMSCAHPENVRWDGGTPGTHCGHCLPCLVRRAAVLAVGFLDAPYQLDVRRNPPLADGDRGRDFRALMMAIERFRSIPATQLVFEVLNSGPLAPDAVNQSIAVYRRGMTELQTLIQGG